MSIVPVTKKIPAGIAGILLGSLGVHKFIMGFPRAGLTMLSLTVVCRILAYIPFLHIFGLIAWAVAVLGFVEGVIYLAKNDHDFYKDYEIYKKEWL